MHAPYLLKYRLFRMRAEPIILASGEFESRHHIRCRGSFLPCKSHAEIGNFCDLRDIRLSKAHLQSVFLKKTIGFCENGPLDSRNPAPCRLAAWIISCRGGSEQCSDDAICPGGQSSGHLSAKKTVLPNDSGATDFYSRRKVFHSRSLWRMLHCRHAFCNLGEPF